MSIEEIPEKNSEKKIIEDNKEPVLTRAEAMERAPKLCEGCGGEVEYWDETNEEVIFQCVSVTCKRFYTIALDPNKITFYFSY
ncbi:hypothetical protein LCGC14_1757110 [marine sediment metagenome]|uniref:Uncharacterized protein n=1 Tax=marine sediment metagenome TaxID=412755 RepID=A0A0F9H265_9ZZZZ|nr:hypothetical protein [bacterium]